MYPCSIRYAIFILWCLIKTVVVIISSSIIVIIIIIIIIIIVMLSKAQC